MKPVNTTLLNLLNDAQGTSSNFYLANLYSFTLVNGQTFYVTDFDQDITLPLPAWPGDTRSGALTFSSRVDLHSGVDKDGVSISQGVGTEVDTMRLILDVPATAQVGAVQMLQAFVLGLMDNALVTLERVFMLVPGNVDAGSVPIFLGHVANITSLDRAHAEFDVQDARQQLNIPTPRNVYQAACRWVLYGTGCTLSKAAFGASSTVGSGSTQQQLLCSLSQVQGYFSEGTVLFTSGANAGVEAAVRTYAPGIFLLYVALPYAIAVGDAFTAYAGCDHTQTTCAQKFNNLVNFGGFPYIPVPETSA